VIVAPHDPHDVFQRPARCPPSTWTTFPVMNGAAEENVGGDAEDAFVVGRLDGAPPGDDRAIEPAPWRPLTMFPAL